MGSLLRWLRIRCSLNAHRSALYKAAYTSFLTSRRRNHVQGVRSFAPFCRASSLPPSPKPTGLFAGHLFVFFGISLLWFVAEQLRTRSTLNRPRSASLASATLLRRQPSFMIEQMALSCFLLLYSLSVRRRIAASLLSSLVSTAFSKADVVIRNCLIRNYELGIADVNPFRFYIL